MCGAGIAGPVLIVCRDSLLSLPCAWCVQGKTEATYRWYRQAILSLWHLHVAGHVARLFKFKNRDGDEEDKDESAAGSKRRAGGAGECARVEPSREGGGLSRRRSGSSTLGE